MFESFPKLVLFELEQYACSPSGKQECQTFIKKLARNISDVKTDQNNCYTCTQSKMATPLPAMFFDGTKFFENTS